MAKPTPTAVRIERISHNLASAIIASNAVNSDGALPRGMALHLHLDATPMAWTLHVSNRYENWQAFLLQARGSRDVVFIYD